MIAHQRGWHGCTLCSARTRGKIYFRDKRRCWAHGDGGGILANRRRAEAHEAAKKLGIAEYEVMDNHDGELMPTLENRLDIIREIREWQADVVISHRTNDYHPDHR